MSQRASDAFARLQDSNPLRDVTPSGRPDVKPSERPRPLRNYTLRIYTQDEAAGVDQLRDLVATKLGRRPNVSELAAAAMNVGPLYVDQIAAYLATRDRA